MRVYLNLIIIFSLVFVFGCSSEPTVEDTQTTQTNQMLDEANRQIGMPNIINFQQKKVMKMIYELCDKEDLRCYLYLFSDFKGQLVYIGECIGYGVPFSAQYTNPMKPMRKWGSGWKLPQADPNGLYMPVTSSATWVIMVNPKDNKPQVTYFEPQIIISPFPLHKGD